MDFGRIGAHLYCSNEIRKSDLPSRLFYSGDETYSREAVTVTTWRKAGQLQKS
jgi:hypothetical protein